MAAEAEVFTAVVAGAGNHKAGWVSDSGKTLKWRERYAASEAELRQI
jgi:hypothetical protein